MRIEIAVAALAAAGLGGYRWWSREGRSRRGRGANREEALGEKVETVGNELLAQLSFAHATNEESELSKRKAAREISRKMAARERGLKNSRSGAHSAPHSHASSLHVLFGAACACLFCHSPSKKAYFFA